MIIKDLDRLDSISQLECKLINQKEAADNLNFTTSQIRRLIRKHKSQEPVGLISQKRGT